MRHALVKLVVILIWLIAYVQLTWNTWSWRYVCFLKLFSIFRLRVRRSTEAEVLLSVKWESSHSKRLHGPISSFSIEKCFQGKFLYSGFRYLRQTWKQYFSLKKFFYKISDNAFSYTGSDLKDTEERHTKLSGTKKFNILGESLV